MKAIVTLAVGLALAGCVAQGPVAPSTGGASLVANAPSSDSFDGLLAAFRASGGVGPVQSNARLDAIARAHALDMVSRGYFGHAAPSGETFADRLRRAGLRPCAAAENIAAGPVSASAVMQRWSNSPGHRANLLNGSVTSYGLGRVDDIWVLVLFKPC